MLIAVGTRSILPGKEAEWETLWARMHEIAQGRPGFRWARLMKSTEHASKYTLLTAWDTPHTWERYYELPEIQDLTQQSFTLFKGAPIQEWHDVIQDIGMDGESGLPR